MASAKEDEALPIDALVGRVAVVRAPLGKVKVEAVAVADFTLAVPDLFCRGETAPGRAREQPFDNALRARTIPAPCS